jgi:hypothetical protein
MVQYKDDVDIVAHNFNNTTLTFAGEHNAVGLEMVEVDRDEDEVETQSVADGMAISVENPIKTGTFKCQVLEAGPTTDWLWAKRNERKSFKITLTDTASPNLNCVGRKCRIAKPPTIKRGKEADVTEWTFVVPYLDMQGGSYRLEAADE